MAYPTRGQRKAVRSRPKPKRMTRVTPSGTKVTNSARSARMNRSSRTMTPDSTGSFRATDVVPQWNLFRNISNAIRRATGGR